MRNKHARFGAHIRKLRMQRGIGLRKLAMTIGMSPTYLSRVERGELPPPAEEQVTRLAKVLGQDEDVLLGEAGRIASDLGPIIKKHPLEYAALLRSLRNLRKKDLYFLFDVIGVDRDRQRVVIAEAKRSGANLEQGLRQLAEYRAMVERIDRKAFLRSTDEDRGRR